MSNQVFNFNFWERRLRDIEDEVQVMYDEASMDGVWDKHDLNELEKAIAKIITFRYKIPERAEKRAAWNKRDQEL